jgi:glycerol kinase
VLKHLFVTELPIHAREKNAMTDALILVIDAGTTSTRAIVFDVAGRVISVANRLIAQHFPQPGWVEHDAQEIISHSLDAARDALAQLDDRQSEVQALGITNQRETVVLWDRKTGAALHRAIVWQDRRTAPICDRLRGENRESLVVAKTGLLLDPYFSATKIAWLLDAIPGARARANAGELAVGTVDSFLIWHLSGGVHVTDATNASRTSLYNLASGAWDTELCELFDVPLSVLPEIIDSAGIAGHVRADHFGRAVPIAGIAGDQQAAAIGQACLFSGMAKITYGTGAFLLVNAGETPPISQNRLLATVAWQINGKRHYALEGSLFVAGSAIQWLRDEVQLIPSAAESEALARSVTSSDGVYLVPAFVGLGAPYWDAAARGLICGLTRGTTRAHIVRAALEAMSYQTNDVIAAFARDGLPVDSLRVDGGMAANGWLMQDVADILNRPVQQPEILETTAWGAAMLAMVGVGLVPSLEVAAQNWQALKSWQPKMDDVVREQRLNGWREAVTRARSELK